MERPAQDIADVVRSLTMGSPQQQEDAVRQYFLSDASFTHPFCRVPSFPRGVIPFAPATDSRSLVLAIYRWYRTLSPRIQLSVESSVFDPRTGLLYLGIHQIFSLWYLPFHKADVQLITVLQLVKRPTADSYHASSENQVHSTAEAEREKGGAAAGPSVSVQAGQGQGQEGLKYYIASQQDFYQVNDALKFVAPTLVSMLLFLLQLLGTVFCVLGSVLMRPIYHCLNDVSDREIGR